MLKLSKTSANNSKTDLESFDPKAQRDSWNAKSLEVNEYNLFHNVADHTRVRGLDIPSMLDQILT